MDPSQQGCGGVPVLAHLGCPACQPCRLRASLVTGVHPYLALLGNVWLAQITGILPEPPALPLPVCPQHRVPEEAGSDGSASRGGRGWGVAWGSVLPHGLAPGLSACLLNGDPMHLVLPAGEPPVPPLLAPQAVSAAGRRGARLPLALCCPWLCCRSQHSSAALGAAGDTGGVWASAVPAGTLSACAGMGCRWLWVPVGRTGLCHHWCCWDPGGRQPRCGIWSGLGAEPPSPAGGG